MRLGTQLCSAHFRVLVYNERVCGGGQADGLPVVCIRATLLITSEFTLRTSKLMNILQGSLETEKNKYISCFKP